MSESAIEAIILFYVIGAFAMGLLSLYRALRRPALIFEEFALAGAWVFVVGGAVWLRAWALDQSFLGFASPLTWLTAAHFHTAGFGALVVAALLTRLMDCSWAIFTMRVVIGVHPIAFACVAAGIAGVRTLEVIGALAYLILFSTTLAVAVIAGAKSDRGDSIRFRIGRMLLLIALAVPLLTILPAIAWSVGQPILNIDDMVLFHGAANAVGHVGLGLFSLALLGSRARVDSVRVPFSRLQSKTALTPAFFDKIRGPRHPCGLTDDLDTYARPDFNPATLHPVVREFYLKTVDFDLEVEGQWLFPFQLGGVLWSRVIARAIGQLGLPAPHETLANAKLTSTMVDLDDSVDGRTNVRGWIRTWRASGRTLYVAAYAEHERNGVRYMNIAFPVPGGNLTSILHLTAIEKGGLRLSSRSGARPGGDQGIYAVRNTCGFRLPLDETIDVIPAQAPNGNHRLAATHTMWVLGLRFLILHYRIHQRKPPMCSSSHI